MVPKWWIWIPSKKKKSDGYEWGELKLDFEG